MIRILFSMIVTSICIWKANGMIVGRFRAGKMMMLPKVRISPWPPPPPPPISVSSVSTYITGHTKDTDYSDTDDNEEDADDVDGTRSGYHEKKECRWLIVGDGDLSYAAQMASEQQQKQKQKQKQQKNHNGNKNTVQIVATVWEDEMTHQKVYKRSKTNTETILQSATSASCNRVLFGIDATKLHTPDTSNMLFTEGENDANKKFHLVDFNFPHWKGKTNARRNRELIDNFLRSAVQVLHPSDGLIRIALHQNQGGLPATSLQEWKQSWLVPMIASEHNLLLCDLEDPFIPTYTQTSHRGVDRPWKKDGILQRYIFRLSGDCNSCTNDENDDETNKNEIKKADPIDPSLQISCRHELKIILPTHHEENGQQESDVSPIGLDSLKNLSVSPKEIIEGRAVYELVERFVPPGIKFDIPEKDILKPYDESIKSNELAVFLINYSGESRPLTRSRADRIRQSIEDAVQNEWGYKVAKAGWMVSKPYPRHLLPHLINEYRRTQHDGRW